MRLAFLFIAVCLMIPASVNAQESPSYINIKAGAFSPTDDFDDAGFESGFNGEIALGRYFDPDGAIEGGIGFYYSEGDTSGPVFDEDNSILIIPVTATVKGILPFKDVNLFAGVGLGIYIADVEVELKNRTTGVSDSFSETDTVFGIHAAIGANVNISSSMFLGFEGRRIWTEEAEFSGSLFGAAQTVESDLNATTLTANLGFRF